MNVVTDSHNAFVGSKVRFELVVPLSTLMDMSVRAFDLAETLLDLEKEVKSWHDGVKDVWNVFGLCMI